MVGRRARRRGSGYPGTDTGTDTGTDPDTDTGSTRWT
jgi:hypothetical protein